MPKEIKIDKEWLENEIAAGKTLKQIEQETGYPDSTLGYKCKKFGIKVERYGGKNIDNIKDQRFGKLVVKYQIPNNENSKAKWFCECDCGNTTEVLGGTLRQHLTKSCGCGMFEATWNGYEDIAGCYWSAIRCSAKSRNLEFNITKEEVWELFLKQNRKCALTGEEIKFSREYWKDLNDQTASLDRIDCSKGYSIDNIQITHKDINFLRSKFPLDKFIFLCISIYNNTINPKKNETYTSPNYKKIKTWNGYGDIKQKLWKRYIKGAKNRNLSFEIDIKFAWELFLKQNATCQLSGLPIYFYELINDKYEFKPTASIDRIDNNKGYTEDNIQWVHKDINKLKNFFDQNKFIKLCCKVAKYFINKRENNEINLGKPTHRVNI